MSEQPILLSTSVQTGQVTKAAEHAQCHFMLIHPRIDQGVGVQDPSGAGGQSPDSVCARVILLGIFSLSALGLSWVGLDPQRNTLKVPDCKIVSCCRLCDRRVTSAVEVNQ